jgi:rubredoxin-NAD+ reductase
VNPIIVIGSGLAGYNLARNLRKFDKAVALTIVTADQGEFYSKPMLSEAFAAAKSPEMLVNKTAEQMASQLGAEIRTRSSVQRVHPGDHEIELDDHRLRYSKLVLALGADAIHPSFAGDGAAGVLSVNDLKDYARFRAAVLAKKRILIVGAGLIGCEFSNDLASAGYHVDVVDIAPQPLGRLLPPAGGAMLNRSLASLGIAWHLGMSVRSIARDGTACRVSLANGEAIDTDVVLSAIGLKPRTALAASAGLRTDRGIVVNRLLETSDPDIYALGDCAQVEGLVLPFTTPIMHAAKALASTLAGKPTALRYPAMPVVVKTPACPTVVAPPPAGMAGEWQVSASSDGVRALFVDGAGTLLGYALNGSAAHDSHALTAQLPAWLS